MPQILKLAIRNLTRHTRKTILVGGLIAAGMGLLFFASSVFESTNEGLESTFVESLTGDVAIGAASATPFSLFGSEIPIVSEYQTIPPMAEYLQMREAFDALSGAAEWAPIVAGAGQLRIESERQNVAVFGVEPESYFRVASDVEIVRGEPSALASGGLFVNETLAAQLENRLERPLEVGEEITISTYADGSFRIRRGTFAGVHRYPSGNQALERVVLADASLARGLINYTLGYTRADAAGGAGQDGRASETGASQAGEDFDMDSLFSSGEDVQAEAGGGISRDQVEQELSETAERDRLVQTDAAAWSFVLFRAEPGERAALESVLRERASEENWGIRVMSWREAAGLSAQVVFALQAAFYAGLVVLGVGAILVIMNALVISVLERRTEIGTMRGIGAKAGFISRLFMTESMLLTLAASLIGIAVGVAVSALTAATGISLQNELLSNLFGGTVLRPIVTLENILMHLGLAVIVGAIAWIYPVMLAVRIQPVTIMSKG